MASAHNNIRTLEGEYNATLFFFQRFTRVRFHLTQVLRASEEGDGFCRMSAKNVWQGGHEVGSYNLPGVMQRAQSGHGCHKSRAVVRASYHVV